MVERISPARSLRGSIQLPGDKSISHRYGILAAIAEGRSTIRNYSSGADCQSTLGCMRALGAAIQKDGGTVVVEGCGLDGLIGPASTLDAGNSGSTIRMLSGILAAQRFTSRIAGDESLSRRPMDRIMKPLAEMGASIRARDGRYPPLEIEGRPLRAVEYTLPVASAQVKTCVLMAGLYCDGETVVNEPVKTRDHTELALRQFGADIEMRRGSIRMTGRPALRGGELNVPGDLSSAAFYLVAASLVPGADLLIANVGLNPTRSALIDFLAGMGASIRVASIAEVNGELTGTLHVRHAPLRGGAMDKALTAALIDEIPVLAVLGAATAEGIEVRDAAELRVKETDRIATVADNLKRMGVEVEVRPDGFRVPGGQRFKAAALDSFGDHRIAMAFSVAALAADGACEVHGAEAAAVSYPEFFDTLRQIAS